MAHYGRLMVFPPPPPAPAFAPAFTVASHRALILAAGIGRRLERPPGEPKALLEFGGRSLLARHVGILRECGVGDITVVAGFGVDRIRGALDGVPVRVVDNPDFRQGSIVSLCAGREVLASDAPVVLMDADVLYDRRLMARLVGSAAPDCLLLDRAIEPGEEPVKLCIRGGCIVDFSKRPRVAHEWHGESVGFFRFSPATSRALAERAGDMVAAGGRHLEYEEAIRDMILANSPGTFGFEEVGDLPWTEIDFPEDIEKARHLLPRLVA